MVDIFSDGFLNIPNSFLRTKIFMNWAPVLQSEVLLWLGLPPPATLRRSFAHMSAFLFEEVRSCMFREFLVVVIALWQSGTICANSLCDFFIPAHAVVVVEMPLGQHRPNVMFFNRACIFSLTPFYLHVCAPTFVAFVSCVRGGLCRTRYDLVGLLKAGGARAQRDRSVSGRMPTKGR